MSAVKKHRAGAAPAVSRPIKGLDRAVARMDRLCYPADRAGRLFAHACAACTLARPGAADVGSGTGSLRFR